MSTTGRAGGAGRLGARHGSSPCAGFSRARKDHQPDRPLCARRRDRCGRAPDGGGAREGAEPPGAGDQSRRRRLAARPDRTRPRPARRLHAVLRGAADGHDALSRSVAARALYAQGLPADRHAPSGAADPFGAQRQPLQDPEGPGRGRARRSGGDQDQRQRADGRAAFAGADAAARGRREILLDPFRRRRAVGHRAARRACRCARRRDRRRAAAQAERRVPRTGDRGECARSVDAGCPDDEVARL